MGGKRLPEFIECGYCGVKFHPINSNSKYCGTTCQIKAITKSFCEVESKKCSKCGETKSSKRFHSSKKSKDGIQSWCRDCSRNKIRKKEYYYYRCEICGKNVRRIKKPTSVEKTRTRRCHGCSMKLIVAANDGHSINYTGTEYFAGRMIATWRASAKRRGHVWCLAKEELDKKFREQQGVCALSGIEMIHNTGSPYRPSIDRIDSNNGYVVGNFQFVCSVLNIMKNKLPEDEFVRLCRKVGSYR